MTMPHQCLDCGADIRTPPLRRGHIPTGSTSETEYDKQDFGGMISNRNTP